MPIDVTVRTLYWMPGCSSCLRLKEFVERTGLSVEEVNIDAKPERRAELENAGAVPPAIRVGDRFANGLNLNEVAELLGVEYDLAPPLPPAALYARYLAIQDAFAKVLATAPEGFLDRTLPGRNRNMLDVAAQVSAVLRSFLAASETGKYDVSSHRRPEDVRTIEDLRGRADETVELFTTWWDRGALIIHSTTSSTPSGGTARSKRFSNERFGTRHITSVNSFTNSTKWESNTA